MTRDNLTPSERIMRSRIAAHTSWARTEDRTARTAAGRSAFYDRFEREVDPDGVLAPAERARRANSAFKAYMTSLAYKSARARRRGKTGADRRAGMTARTIASVWARIEEHEGETFRQKRGGDFTYEVHGDYLKLSRTNHSVPKKHVAEALAMVPLDGPGQITHLRAPSYIWAILMDDRIQAGEW